MLVSATVSHYLNTRCRSRLDYYDINDLSARKKTIYLGEFLCKPCLYLWIDERLLKVIFDLCCDVAGFTQRVTVECILSSVLEVTTSWVVWRWSCNLWRYLTIVICLCASVWLVFSVGFAGGVSDEIVLTIVFIPRFNSRHDQSSF